MRALPRASVSLPMVPDASTLMDWAESNYPAHFPGTKLNASLAPYLYRYYPETGNYLGVAGDEVFVLGPVSGGQVLAVGRLGEFACQVYPDSCQQATDSRNGSYIAYSTAGERFTITVDFDAGTYGIAGITFPAYEASGSFTAASTAGSYIFQPAAAAAPAGFRYVDDLLVGSFDTGIGTRPFVAGRRFAQSLSEALGSYGIFGINREASGSAESYIYPGRLSADSKMRICWDLQIYPIDQCPASSVVTYDVTRNGDEFTATNASSSYKFRVAQAAGQNIYLWTFADSSSGRRYFRIGLQESANSAAAVTYGANTAGAQVSQTWTASRLTSSGVSASGTAVALNGNLQDIAGPSGLYSMYGVGFVMQNPQLTVLIGAQSGAYKGFLQLGGR
jgi:hypothetical protein